LIRWRLRDALFPRSEYARTWQHLIEQLPEAKAARTMIALLEIAAGEGCEARLAEELGMLLDRRELPDPEQLKSSFATHVPTMPTVTITLPTLGHYDTLMVRA
jgi:hypothetical protein